MKIIAHRGASHDAPENTLAAMQLAWEQGADAVEVDVQYSRDQRLVVIHDDTTQRTTGCNARVADLDLAALKALDAGSWKGGDWRQERVPSLSEAFDAMPAGKQLFVEIKCGPECVPEFERCFKASELDPSQLAVIAYSLETLRLLKARLPAVAMHWVVKFSKALPLGRWKPLPETVIGQVSAAGLDGVDASAQAPWSADWIRAMHDAGLKAYVWTVDDARHARQLAGWGIDGITTNRPGWLRAQLDDAHHGLS